MALYALRLRRAAVSLSSSILHNHTNSLFALPHSAMTNTISSTLLNPQSQKALRPSFQVPSTRLFRSSSISLSSRGRFDPNTDEIGPDTILFEGCDYNHWLITMDFPKDPKPSPEEMVETYVQTAAKVLGSVEEAKKKIYACSTTTYTGFQVEVSEEVSEKFKDLPGVVFVLPDSYIDPVNKEYGGDKYINGQIIPRPPPIQYGRQGPRPNRNRDFNRNPGYDNQRQMNREPRNYGPPPQQNLGPQQYPPQQNYGPPQSSPHQNYGPPQGPPQPSYGPPQGPPQPNYGPPPGHHQNYVPPQGPQQNYGQPQNSPFQQNYGPPGAGERRGPMPINNVPGGWNSQQGYNQGQQGNFYPQGQRDFQRDQSGYARPEQRGFVGENQNYAPQDGPLGQGPSGDQGQGAASAYGQNFPRHSDQRNY